MAIGHFIKEIGRGKDGARPLSRGQAADLFGQLLDGDVSDLGQVTFEIVGILEIEELADDRAQDGVAEKLESLVTSEPMVGPRRMRQGGHEQGLVLKLITNTPFATLQVTLFRSGSSALSHRKEPLLRIAKNAKFA